MNVIERIRDSLNILTSSDPEPSEDTTAKFLVQEAARRVGIMPPESIDAVNESATNPEDYDADAAILLSGLNHTLTDVMVKEGLVSNYKVLYKRFEIIEPTETSYETFSLPDDFGSFVSSGIIVAYYPIEAPSSAELNGELNPEYLKLIELKEGDSDSFLKYYMLAYLQKDISKENLNYVNRFKVINNKELVYIHNLSLLKYFKVLAFGIYKSLYGVREPGKVEPKKYFSEDVDYTDIDAELLIRGTALYYAQTMGIDSRLHQQRYEEYLASLIKNQANKNRIVDSSMTYHALGRGHYG
jgi:hypothetical protein